MTETENNVWIRCRELFRFIISCYLILLIISFIFNIIQNMVKAKKKSTPNHPSAFNTNVSKAWNSNSQDGIELRSYVELGFCDGFGINDLLNKYPQFNAYDRKTVYNAVGRYRKTAEKNLDDRANLNQGSK